MTDYLSPGIPSFVFVIDFENALKSGMLNEEDLSFYSIVY